MFQSNLHKFCQNVHIAQIEELKEMDVRHMSISRLLAIASNSALQQNRPDLHMKILDLRDEI